MAATLIKQVRLDQPTVDYYQALADKDKRSLAGYMQLVLEAVKTRGLTWQEIENPAPKKP